MLNNEKEKSFIQYKTRIDCRDYRTNAKVGFLQQINFKTRLWGGGERNSYFGDKIKAGDVHFGRNEHQQKNVQGLLGCSFKLHATCSATTSSISDLQKGELELQLNISAHLNTLGMLLSLT
jgi:hypothetical protein